MEIFDTHCHLDVEEFDADRAEVIAAARASRVTGIAVPAIHRGNWDRVLSLCASQAGLYPGLGMHPVYIGQHREEHLQDLRRTLSQERAVIAVGEIGLDYHVEGLARDRQQHFFERQLEIARDADLPVLLHVRKAHDAVLAALRRIRVKGGIAHAYNGSLQQARQYIDLGFRLGFGGTLTYERSRRIRALARELPREAIVLETDAPDMVVSQHRGERNSPAYLHHCLEALAAVRGEDIGTLAMATTRSARAVLGLDEGDHAGAGVSR